MPPSSTTDRNGIWLEIRTPANAFHIPSDNDAEVWDAVGRRPVYSGFDTDTKQRVNRFRFDDAGMAAGVGQFVCRRIPDATYFVREQ